MVFFALILFGIHWTSWIFKFMSFNKFGNFPAVIFSNILFCTSHFLLSLGTPKTWVLDFQYCPSDLWSSVLFCFVRSSIWISHLSSSLTCASAIYLHSAADLIQWIFTSNIFGSFFKRYFLFLSWEHLFFHSWFQEYLPLFHGEWL